MRSIWSVDGDIFEAWITGPLRRRDYTFCMLILLAALLMNRIYNKITFSVRFQDRLSPFLLCLLGFRQFFGTYIFKLFDMYLVYAKLKDFIYS